MGLCLLAKKKRGKVRTPLRVTHCGVVTCSVVKRRQKPTVPYRSHIFKHWTVSDPSACPGARSWHLSWGPGWGAGLVSLHLSWGSMEEGPGRPPVLNTTNMEMDEGHGRPPPRQLSVVKRRLKPNVAKRREAWAMECRLQDTPGGGPSLAWPQGKGYRLSRE